jgi:glutaredoxin|tara:strand:+ start:116 stop:565 length:450 start_codon:yes stop_codon:yes gene_type:complete
MKIYTNPSCHYCKKVKDALDAAEITYEEIITSENFTEWNDLLRITGLAVTPTIVFQEEVWLPNRDFRTPEELVARVKHFVDSPMPVLKLEDRVDQLFNSVKNIALLLNNLGQTIQQIQQQTAGTPNIVNNPQGNNPQPNPQQTQPQEQV